MKKALVVLMMVLLATMLIVSCDGNSKKVYTVTFNSKGGSTVAPVEVKEGEKVAKPTDPTNTDVDAVFSKWTTDEAGKEEYNFESPVNADITLYAQWRDFYKAGDTGPAGGIIFYVNPDYEKGSTDSAKNWKYLEAAPVALVNEFTWGSIGSEYNTEDGIGKGKSNTDTLVGKATGGITFPAAEACARYSLSVENGETYDDWFLPSIDEMGMLYTVKDKLDSYSLNKEYFWTSTGYSDDCAKEKNLKSGGWYGQERTKSFYVWPVRVFSLI